MAVDTVAPSAWHAACARAVWGEYETRVALTGGALPVASAAPMPTTDKAVAADNSKTGRTARFDLSFMGPFLHHGCDWKGVD